MKQLYILLLTIPLLCHTYPLDDTSSIEDSELAETDPQITKRSGGLDLVTHLKSGILSSLSKASASLASGSSGGSGSYKSIDSGHGNSVDFDPWSLKKSVLNTIFQAVKAITGGVTALKGQLIKGSGYVLSAGGKLVAASGDKVTDVGKSIINSAQLSPPPQQNHGGGSSSHPFFKLSSLSGGSSDGGHGPGPVLHSETITTYEIPPGHHNYGPPSKPPSFSSATHQYLPPQSYSGGAPFANHAAFEAAPSNYLPSKYGPSYEDGHDAFLNIYGPQAKLSDKEVRRAAESLQEILQLLPKKKLKDTTKTVTIENDNDGYAYPEPSDITQYVIPPMRQLESVSHVETVTAAYGPPLPHKINSGLENKNPSDIYRQMAHRQKDTTTTGNANESPSQSIASDGYSYPNPHRDYSHTSSHQHQQQNQQPPPPPPNSGGFVKNIVKSTSYQVNLDPYRSSPPSGPNYPHQSKAKQQYTYFNPAQNKIDTPFVRRRDLRQSIRKFEYLRDSQIRNAAMFNRNMML